ncbi:GNAT family N-acetyltransferase [Kocuria sp. JC486]|uniref:GNAT family N-acetyltransferase n=1 Tax=Kocuria sp. JC486 TaxID=1970736 RepID=UPI00141D942D|nr:GNAT family N-acetyltransferase [Kocuria sp. JC486]NHU85910.1 GNAT family N-acetyltransferase [Kocuria sp. JC486]
MSPHHLRTRTPADCETVVGWVPDVEALHLFTGPRMTWPLTSGQLSTMEGSGLSAWMLVADDTDAALGHFDLTLDGQSARIGRVLIDPARRGHGLAHVLIGLAMEKTRELGAMELRLNVMVGNEPAIRTYARAGFIEMEQSDRPDVHVMTRSM